MSSLRLGRRPGVARQIVVRNVRCEAGFVAATIHVGTVRHCVEVHTPHDVTPPGADPFVPLTLLPALVLGADVRVEGEVTEQTLRAAERVQCLFARWFPELHPVRVDAAPRSPGPPAYGVASLFSGGVDSYYSALEGYGELTNLLFVLGFDVPLEDSPLRELVLTRIRAAAAALDLPLLEARTNLRAFLDPYVPWHFAHGPAIAAVAMTLTGRLGEIRIPSSSIPMVCGTHPELDPLWSTIEQRFVHHAPGVGRLAKLRLVARSATAMQYLRVCWENVGGEYNCGHCEKCLRTLAGLRIVGGGASAPSFPSPLDLSAVRRARVPDVLTEHLWRELRAGALAAGDDELAVAVEAALRAGRVARAVERVRDLAGRVPRVRRAWRLVKGALWDDGMP
jgi:hypothetical protein